MTESELARALHELPPEPPRGLSADDLLQRARRQRALRLSAVAASMAIAGAVGVTAIHAGAARSTSVAVAPEPAASNSAAPTESPPTPLSNPPAVDMHADTLPGSATTTRGSADLDRDGKPDAVTVSAKTGLVVVELGSGAELTAQLPEAANGRLQGLPDLLGDGHREVLVYSSAAGCCGYAPVDSQSYVLAIVRGGLSLVRFENGKPLQLSFSNGRGDSYAQVKCLGDGSIINSYFHAGGLGGGSYSSIKIEGSLASGVTVDDGRQHDMQDFPVAVGCAGLRADGRAS